MGRFWEALLMLGVVVAMYFVAGMLAGAAVVWLSRRASAEEIRTARNDRGALRIIRAHRSDSARRAVPRTGSQRMSIRRLVFTLAASAASVGVFAREPVVGLPCENCDAVFV